MFQLHLTFRKLFVFIVLVSASLVGNLSSTVRNTMPTLYAASLQSIEADVVPLQNVKQITLGYAHTCVLTNSGNVMCWGRNNSGEW